MPLKGFIVFIWDDLISHVAEPRAGYATAGGGCFTPHAASAQGSGRQHTRQTAVNNFWIVSISNISVSFPLLREL